MLEKGSALNCTTEEYNELLTMASLFEGAFSIDWIQEATRKKATKVLCVFEKAVQEGVLKRDAIGSFAFATAKKLRTWRNKLSDKEKSRYNHLIVDLMIKELPDSEQKAEMLAPYLLNISNDIDGCNWLMAAAGRYHASFKEEMALQCYSKILDDLSGLSGKGTDQIFCDAALQYSKLTTARHETQRVLSILEEAMVRAKNQSNYRYQSLLDMHFAKNKWLQSQYNSALKHFEQAWSMARDLDDERLLRSTATFKTFFLFWQGRFQDAVNDYEKAVPDVEKFPYGRFPLLATMTIGTCYGKTGQVTQGIGMMDSIRRLCLERGDIGLASHSGICIGAILLDNGCVQEACRHLIPSVKEAKAVHPDWTMIQGELVLAYAYYLQGKYEQCRDCLAQYIEHAKQVQVSVRTWPYLMELSWAIEEGKLSPLQGISIRDEVNQMIRGQNLFLKGVAYRFKSLLQKKEGEPHSKLIRTLKRSIKFLEISGHSIELAKSELELARIYLLQGNRKLAIQTADPAFKSLCSTNKGLIPDDLKPLIKHTTEADTLFKEIVRFNNELSVIDLSKDAIQHIISTANRIVGAERGAIFLWEGMRRNNRFHLRASKNLNHDQIELPDFVASIKMMTEVVSRGEGQVQSLQDEKGSNLLREATIRSCICVPVVNRQQILGVLYHDNRLLGNAFDTSQLEILSFFAAQIAMALENDKIHRENRQLNKRLRDLTAHYEKQSVQDRKSSFEEVIGESTAIKKVLSQVGEVASTNATVLILGETGVGKGVVAKAIQANSERRDKPFISLNCNALSEALIYSELFGHEKGAFTGADHQHIGRFEKANGGTLFLDEIGDLPMDVQVRLLRVLETKQFERVGATNTISSDFRLIAATNTDLVEAIKEKRFREDFFYRINVFSIYVPPLRERREDIPLLIEHFLKIQAAETGKPSRPITDEEMMELTQYRWPGNVRELKNITEKYAISGAASQTSIVEILDAGNMAVSENHQPITLQENERRHILWALEQTGGKIHGPGGAAELLDVHPNTLAFRIKKLGIQRPKKGRKGSAK